MKNAIKKEEKKGKFLVSWKTFSLFFYFEMFQLIKVFVKKNVNF